MCLSAACLASPAATLSTSLPSAPTNRSGGCRWAGWGRAMQPPAGAVARNGAFGQARQQRDSMQLQLIERPACAPRCLDWRRRPQGRSEQSSEATHDTPGWRDLWGQAGKQEGGGRRRVCNERCRCRSCAVTASQPGMECMARLPHLSCLPPHTGRWRSPGGSGSVASSVNRPPSLPPRMWTLGAAAASLGLISWPFCGGRGKGGGSKDEMETAL